MSKQISEVSDASKRTGSPSHAVAGALKSPCLPAQVMHLCNQKAERRREQGNGSPEVETEGESTFAKLMLRVDVVVMT